MLCLVFFIHYVLLYTFWVDLRAKLLCSRNSCCLPSEGKLSVVIHGCCVTSWMVALPFGSGASMRCSKFAQSLKKKVSQECAMWRDYLLQNLLVEDMLPEAFPQGFEMAACQSTLYAAALLMTTHLLKFQHIFSQTSANRGGWFEKKKKKCLIRITISGAAKAGLPQKVLWSFPCCEMLLKPKSISLTVPSAVTRMLLFLKNQIFGSKNPNSSLYLGLISRWKMPISWQ